MEVLEANRKENLQQTAHHFKACNVALATAIKVRGSQRAGSHGSRGPSSNQSFTHNRHTMPFSSSWRGWTSSRRR